MSRILIRFHQSLTQSRLFGQLLPLLGPSYMDLFTPESGGHGHEFVSRAPEKSIPHLKLHFAQFQQDSSGAMLELHQDNRTNLHHDFPRLCQGSPDNF